MRYFLHRPKAFPRARKSPRRKRIKYCLVWCAALTAAGAIWAHAARPAERWRRSLQFLRAGNAERVEYETLTLASRPEYEAQASLLRSWLLLRSSLDASDARQAILWDELQYALEDKQHGALTLALMGQAAYQAGHLSRALGYLDQSLKIDAAEVEAHRWLGAIFYDIGLWSKALDELERVAGAEPRNGGVRHLMGLILRERAEYAAAADAYQESLDRDPTQHDADEIRQDLAACFVKLHRYDDALATIIPARPTAGKYLVLAECYAAREESDRALAAIDEALRFDSDNGAAIGIKSDLLRTEGKLRQAADLLAKSVEKKPRDYALRYRLVSACRLLGDDRAAEEAANGMEDLRRLNERYQELLERAAVDAADASLRYEIAALAQQLDMDEAAENWLKAARLLEQADLRRWLSPSTRSRK